MAIRTLDLFCGGGGSSWGARAAGARIVCGVDASPFAVDTYRRNFPEARVVEMMLDDTSGAADIPDLGRIDLLLASPECTHHTCARGARPREESSRLTARYVLNFARELRPRWVVVENVVHMKGWDGYRPLVSELEAAGYNVLPQELDSSRLGVPQKRRRLFLLCDRREMPRPVILRSGRPKSARSILDPADIWKSRIVGPDTHATATLARIEAGIAALGRRVPFLVVYYGSDGAGGWQALDRPLRTLTTLDRFGLVTWDGDTPMMRMLQVPELQAAMGFGPEFNLTGGSRRDRIRILGNGVCPPVMEAIVSGLTGQSSRPVRWQSRSRAEDVAVLAS
jgi:DNA (cytosine-5)-methyltransferase 1